MSMEIPAECSTTSHQRHLGSHYRYKLHVGVQRQARHEHDRVGNVAHIHARLHSARAVGLQDAGVDPVRHFGGSVADIDLAASDFVFTAIQRETLGDPGDGVFGGGIGHVVGTGTVRGDRTVVDNAPA